MGGGGGGDVRKAVVNVRKVIKVEGGYIVLSLPIISKVTKMGFHSPSLILYIV